MTSITLRPDVEARLRYGWEQWLQTRLGQARPRTFEQWLADLVRDVAASYPEPPKPAPARRSLSQLRAESRERNGGVGAYTAAITLPGSVRPPDKEQP